MSGFPLHWAQERWKALRRRRDQEPPRERAVKVKEIGTEFTTEELQDFLEGDLYPAQADPAFKEALRRKLWAMLQARHGHPEEPKRGR